MLGALMSSAAALGALRAYGGGVSGERLTVTRAEIFPDLATLRGQFTTIGSEPLSAAAVSRCGPVRRGVIPAQVPPSERLAATGVPPGAARTSSSPVMRRLEVGAVGDIDWPEGWTRGRSGTKLNSLHFWRIMYETLLYTVSGAVATITLNRPEHLNTIVPPMPDEFQDAMVKAERAPEVKVIVLRGAGRSFSGGYDFGNGFHYWDDLITTDGEWDSGKDFVFATAPTHAPTQKFMSMWRSPKPVIAQVHGWCVGGASETALCADIVIASEDARIGTPYSRMWGCHLSGMWIYRLGLAKAKEYALTGKPVSGLEAAEIGLINKAVPFEDLEAEVAKMAQQLVSVPMSQLSAMKLIVNQAYENMGLASTQTLGPILDGLMRNTPEAKKFITLAEQEGVAAMLAERDGPFGDYSHGAPEDKPNPNNVIKP